MGSAFRYNEMKTRIPEIKELFRTRHYIQCASRCERFFTRSKYEELVFNKEAETPLATTFVFHPVHQACLHFYFALSHDTMAREASMSKRSSALDLAEKHYIAALVALTPAEPTRSLEDIQEVQSPTSSTSHSEDHHSNFIGHRRSSASLTSQQSNASSGTSYTDDEDFFADWETPDLDKYSSSYQSDYALTPKSPKKRPSPIITDQFRFFPQQQFSMDLCAFIDMVELHLASVRELKEAVPEHRFSFSPRSRSSTVSSRPVSRDSILHGDAAGMERLRQSRKSMVFKPRFDPSDIRRLCRDALSEL